MVNTTNPSSWITLYFHLFQQTTYKTLQFKNFDSFWQKPSFMKLHSQLTATYKTESISLLI